MSLATVALSVGMFLVVPYLTYRALVYAHSNDKRKAGLYARDAAVLFAALIAGIQVNATLDGRAGTVADLVGIFLVWVFVAMPLCAGVHLVLALLRAALNPARKLGGTAKTWAGIVGLSLAFAVYAVSITGRGPMIAMLVYLGVNLTYTVALFAVGILTALAIGNFLLRRWQDGWRLLVRAMGVVVATFALTVVIVGYATYDMIMNSQTEELGSSPNAGSTPSGTCRTSIA
jgi:hypothetical protein